METMYKNAPPVEETELAFCKRKMQDRADTIHELRDTNLKLRHALGDIEDILEAVFG